jgi:polar amino acid transport system substrate-binding protein
MHRRLLKGLTLVGMLAAVAVVVAAATAGTSRTRTDAATLPKGSVVKIGVAVGPPFLLRTPSGTWTSFSAELIRQFGQAEGLKIQFVATSWPTMIAGLQANKYDLTQPINATPERRAVVNFSSAVSAAGVLYFVPKNSKYHTLADLNNTSVTIATISGSAEEEVTRKLLPKAKLRSLTSASVADLATEVVSGRSNVFVDSSYIAPPVTKKFGLTTIPSYASKPNGLEPVNIGFSMRKNEGTLLRELNAFIAKQKANGGLKKLAAKWLTYDNILKG